MNLKYLFAFCFVFGLYAISNAQENRLQNRKGKIGITFSSFGENDVSRPNELPGSGSFHGDRFYSVGLNYDYPLNGWLDLETGIEYSKHYLRIEPPFMPDSPGSPYDADFSLISVPVMLKATALKYFFVNGGLFLGFDSDTSNSIDSQSGIGGVVGAGIKYDFDFGARLFVNPYYKFHSLIPFSSVDNRQELWESGIRFGIMVNLGGGR